MTFSALAPHAIALVNHLVDEYPLNENGVQCFLKSSLMFFPRVIFQKFTFEENEFFRKKLVKSPEKIKI